MAKKQYIFTAYHQPIRLWKAYHYHIAKKIKGKDILTKEFVNLMYQELLNSNYFDPSPGDVAAITLLWGVQ